MAVLIALTNIKMKVKTSIKLKNKTKLVWRRNKKGKKRLYRIVLEGGNPRDKARQG